MRKFMCSIAVAAVFCATVVQAQPLADRVPEDAVLYIGWSGAGTLPAAYQQSHLKGLLDHSNIPALFNQLLPQLMRKLAREQPDVHEGLQIFTTLSAPLWKHPTAIYFRGIEFENDDPMPKIALICRAGGEAQGIHNALSALMDEMDGDVPLRAFLSGEYVGITVGMNDAEVLAAEGAGLAASAAFKSALSKVQSDPVVVCYGDIERLAAIIDRIVEMNAPPEAQELWPRAREASGLFGIKRFILTDGFDGKDWGTRAFIEIPEPRTGLLAGMDATPLSDDLVRAIPQSATIVYAGKLDFARVVAELRDVVGAVDPEAQRMFDQGLGDVDRMMGRNLQRDILEPLGDEWATYIAPTVAGSGMTGLVVINKLDDPTKAEQGLVGFSVFINKMIAGQIPNDGEMTVAMKKTTIDGMTVWYFAVPFVSPAWAIKDGYLYMGLYPQSVGAAARFTTSGQKSFLENEKFNAIKQRLGVQAPRGIQFVDLPEMAAPAYQMILMYLRLGLGFADMWGLDVPEPVLPAFDQLLAHLAPAGAVSWVDEEGWHYRGVRPFPGAGLFSGEQGVAVGASAMMVSIMLPSLNRARETANRVKCASNMRMLGQGLFTYANDTRGQLPPDFETLAEYMSKMHVAADVFVCPSGNRAAPPHVPAPHESDYVYIGAGRNIPQIRPADILLYERPGPHDRDGVNVLFGDGHVEFVTLDRLRRDLEKQGMQMEEPARR